MLALIVVLAIICRIVVVMMAMMMVIALMNVILVVLVGVHEKAREGANRRCKGHAHHRRDGKHERHRPNEGDAASACSFQSGQHAFR